MDALFTAGEWLAVLAGGLVVRFLAALAIAAAIAAVLVPVLYAFEGGRRVLRRVRGFGNLHGFEWRRRAWYAPTHVWLRHRGSAVRLGIDAVAARLLARGRAIDVAPVGSQIGVGDPMVTVRTGEKRILLPSPLAGTVTGINTRLARRPDLVAQHPYGTGWLVEMRPADRSFERLPRADGARQWFDAEAVRLTLALEHATGRAAADGGVPTVPDHLRLTDEQIGQLSQEFLGASVAARTR